MAAVCPKHSATATAGQPWSLPSVLFAQDLSVCLTGQADVPAFARNVGATVTQNTVPNTMAK